MARRGLWPLLLLLGCGHALEIQSPPGWQRQAKVPPGILVQYLSPPARGGRFAPNLNISEKRLTPPLSDSLRTADQLGRHMEAIQARVFPMFQLLDRAPRKVGEADGMVFVTRYAFGAMDLAAFQFVYRLEDRMVNVVYTCLLADLPVLRPSFERSLASLQDAKRMH